MENIFGTHKVEYIGLSSQEAEAKLKEFGFNARKATPKKGPLKKVLKIFSEPMMLLILVTAFVYFLIGEKVEATIFIFSLIPIALIEFFQEQKTDNALSALDKMMLTSAQVYRDGKLATLETKYIVPGDMIYLTAGDKVPADGYVHESAGFMVDESMLTGESSAVIKSKTLNPKNLMNENKLFQGCFVTQGDGTMIAQLTGSDTAYGKLGELLGKIKKTKTPLQLKINQFLKIVAIGAVSSAFVITIVLIFIKGLVAGILAGLTIAMALIPEEIPIVFSVFLVLGVFKMAKHNALIREMALVETLGSVTVICSDKTGTLTEGRMSLKKIFWKDKIFSVEDSAEDFLEFIKMTVLALERIAIDPIEVEVHRFANSIGLEPTKLFEEYSLLQDRPFEAKTKMVHHLWQNKAGLCLQFSAGAPEFIIANSLLNLEERSRAMSILEEMASQGYRVIGIARRLCSVEHGINDRGLEFLGLLIMSDPPREEVKEAIDICQKAGIRVMMITGDNKLTAHSVAEGIGLKHNEEILDGEEIEKASPDALKQKLKWCSIFARVKPEQKFLIVRALQELGEVVAMTGDGVNDAPALKKANIGIAMGKKGTEVAREASGMVLMDDNFSTIVHAVREGRKIYDNIRHAFVFLLSFHIPILGLAIAPLFLNQSFIFLPIHIIFLELICDPAAVLGFERESARRGLMKEKPRSPNEPIISKSLLVKILIQGFGIFILSFSLYYFCVIILKNPELGRTSAFVSLVLGQISLLLFTREWFQIVNNKIILTVSALTVVFITLVLFVPFLRHLFHFSEISIKVYALIFVITLLFIALVSLIVLKLKKNDSYAGR